MVYIEELIKELKKYDKVLVTGHMHPDGDCYGSTTAMNHILLSYGINSIHILEEKLKRFEFLPGFDNVVTYEDFDNKEFDLEDNYAFVVLDSGDRDRFPHLKKVFKNAALTINIDHHISNNNFADINIVDVKASSACEVVGMIIGADESEEVIDYNIAKCLYTGILTDSGGFRFESTRKSTMNIVANCMSKGIPFTDIINRLFYSKTLNEITAIKIALNNLEIFHENELAFTVITQEELIKNGLTKADTEAVVSMLNQLKGIKACGFLIEIEKDKFKASFRSSSAINVCNIATKYGGGGHIKAAGCTICGKYLKVKDKVCNALIEEYKNIG